MHEKKLESQKLCKYTFNEFLSIQDVRAEKWSHEWLGEVLGVSGLAPSARKSQINQKALTITHESYNIVQKCIFLFQEFELEFNRLIFFYEIHNDYTKLSEIFKYRL